MMRNGIRRAVLGVAVGAGLLVPAIATAHVERASYWPDPKTDFAVDPPAGGRVPNVRSLESALDGPSPGVTRVVCQPDSLDRALKSIAIARTTGYTIRPHDHRVLTEAQANTLIWINARLKERCAYGEIQPAVTASGNNDRVVIMPGLYTEPTSRAQPSNDPRCDKYEIGNDRGQTGAVSYKYQKGCPNDQNLIAVLGRSNGGGHDPQPPLDDRHLIPNLGPCIRCNLQIEGSGPGPDDVVVDAGRVKSGNRGPIGAKKDVGIRADRADGFVLRNVTVRHAGEHGIYVLESDGYVLERFRTFYSGEYGVLTFVEDHGLMQDCEAVGNGDSGLYPGSSADTGDQRPPGTPRRYSQEIRRCDSHHNASGYSGTDGNAVHLHHNNFYDNALGFTTDVFTASGHPGYPQDSDLVEYNNFYSNNYNLYRDGADVEPSVPVPVGTGLWIAGGNHNIIRHNRFWDNWRRGVMLFSVPDAFVCAPPDHQAGCDPAKISTSYRNRFYGNIMGVTPGGGVKPNGTDFWWDSFAGNTRNCWYRNIPAPGRSITTSPSSLPDCNNGKDPSLSIGTGYPPNEAELLNCLGDFSIGTGTCPWFSKPPKPS